MQNSLEGADFYKVVDKKPAALLKYKVLYRYFQRFGLHSQNTYFSEHFSIVEVVAYANRIYVTSIKLVLIRWDYLFFWRGISKITRHFLSKSTLFKEKSMWSWLRKKKETFYSQHKILIKRLVSYHVYITIGKAWKSRIKGFY